MFPAYGDKNSPSLNDQTRWALQKTATLTKEQRERNVQRQQEEEVYQQAGYGDSSSEDDGICIKVNAPSSSSAGQRSMAGNSMGNSYSSFPSAPAPVENGRKRSRSRDRSRSRSRDRYDNRRRSKSRERSRKKKEKRRRRRSSSSSDRSSSPRRRESPPRKQRFQSNQKIKYKFLSYEESASCYSLQTNILIRQTKFDPENCTLMIPKNEIAFCRLGVGFILGRAYDVPLFQKLYGSERLKQNKENRPFHERLVEVKNHHPSERFFRRKKPVDGYWELIANKDILNTSANDFNESGLSCEQDNMMAELMGYRQRFSQNVHDIEALLKCIEMEEEMAENNRGSFARSNSEALNERLVAMLDKAIKWNPKNVAIKLLRLEKVKKTSPSEYIERIYLDLIGKHPYDPMTWISYLNYYQYEKLPYTYNEMDCAFQTCLKKLEGLLMGTDLAYKDKVVDLPQFQMFHLSIFIRMLKWNIDSGHTPQALATIQATFELNLGFGEKDRAKPKKERLLLLQEFWLTGLPRIGDSNALGIEKMEKQVKNMTHKEICDTELACYDRLIAITEEAITSCLRVDRNVHKNWVYFERKMQNVDARVKRTPLDECHVYTEECALDFAGIEFWPILDFQTFMLYVATTGIDALDYVQPLLEVLGIEFLHSTGCYSTSQKVISDWIPRDNTFNEPTFDQTPTYSEETCRSVGMNILQFLLYQRYDIVKKEQVVVDDRMLKYMLAELRTKVVEMESELVYHQLRYNKCQELLNIIQTHAEIFKGYRDMGRCVTLVAIEQVIGWWERALNDQELMEKKAKVTADQRYFVLPGDKKALQIIKDKLWIALEKLFPKSEVSLLRSESSTLPVLQFHLYANVLRARFHVLNEKGHEEIRKFLAMNILEEDQTIINSLEASGELEKAMERSLEDLQQVIRKREEEGMESGISELPRASALVEGLRVAMVFVSLRHITLKRKTVESTVSRIIENCENYEKLEKDWKKGQSEKYKDRVDIKFLLDLMFIFLSNSTLSIDYHEDLKRLVSKASDAFPCETRYMKMLAEMHSTVRHNSIKFCGKMETWKKDLRRISFQRFGLDSERKLLQKSLAVMYCSMKVCSRIDENSARMLYQCYEDEAVGLFEPVLWRLALKQASRIGPKYIDKPRTRMQATCPWSINNYIDYVEEMGTYRTANNHTALADTLMYLMGAIGGPHIIYIDDETTLETHVDIASQT